MNAEEAWVIYDCLENMLFVISARRPFSFSSVHQFPSEGENAVISADTAEEIQKFTPLPNHHCRAEHRSRRLTPSRFPLNLPFAQSFIAHLGHLDRHKQAAVGVTKPHQRQIRTVSLFTLCALRF
jgi:hypothetical protein